MSKKIRSALIKRKTKETDISGKLMIDGKGDADIDTGIGFLDHMLTLFIFHGIFDLSLKAKGDLKVDTHHTNEDVAICLGKAFKEALGDSAGIKRFGSKEVPMDLASAKVMVDVGGRYAFLWRTPPSGWAEQVSRDE
jgi:imidazoleglycerol-phosphate dehydratase